jgi:hypothetical protein
MQIKKYQQFKEAISGWELVGHMGPNYGEQENSPMKGMGDVDVIYSDYYNRAVTQDQYQDYHTEYLKKGGTPLHGFNKDNLEKVLSVISDEK